MGLQNQLTDVSSGSIPVFVLAIIANGVCYLRSFVFSALHSLGLSQYHPDDVDEGMLLDAVGSGLAGLIVLTEQLNLNRAFSYKYRKGDEEEEEEDTSSSSSSSGVRIGGSRECVVCLNRLREGEQVRKLGCQHVFHKECFDGWLDHMNFNCPLCRSPLVLNERVASTRRHMAGDPLAWFSM